MDKDFFSKLFVHFPYWIVKKEETQLTLRLFTHIAIN